MGELATPERAKQATRGSLGLRFYSHATLECLDIAKTRRFFEEFLGFETVQMADISFWARLGGDQIIVVVQSPTGKKQDMPFLNHNGLDVATDADVDAAWATIKEHQDEWGMSKVTKPLVQHGTYCFYFTDMDGNMWEILSNPEGGYRWGFERGDQEGKGHMSRDFARPETTS
ncbi:MAG: VOC family protein [Sphingomonadaceae bacterium]|jgi:catechol 2,3-dioxygenase-like lactoylglutathione lyase family enzyme|nr:VOC family protein [Sphingomonadaceae bacterium]MCB2086345.1 VOC family protein [Sphingomonadaceae bacterium]MCP5383353.1 VOC family protein [Altererythrobacter sp.]MCP5391231.1 VOC family protein [Sphingomonadaceae bacterium]MCP5393530.1 VOC family protein [Sphingomonadaceae bacterium]